MNGKMLIPTQYTSPANLCTRRLLATSSSILPISLTDAPSAAPSPPRAPTPPAAPAWMMDLIKPKPRSIRFLTTFTRARTSASIASCFSRRVDWFLDFRTSASQRSSSASLPFDLVGREGRPAETDRGCQFDGEEACKRIDNYHQPRQFLVQWPTCRAPRRSLSPQLQSLLWPVPRAGAQIHAD